MKLLFWIVAIPALALAMSFGVSNPESVAIRLWPLKNSVEMPLYGAVTVALFFGFLVGALIAWIDGLRHRTEARRLARRLHELETETARLQGELAAAQTRHAEPAADAELRRLTAAATE